MIRNECPICHRYFPVGLYAHIEECRDREMRKAPHGYESFKDYLDGNPAKAPKETAPRGGKEGG